MIILPELPYAYGALEPVLSEVTLRTHHGRHHARYVEVANRLIAERGAPAATLEAVVTDAWADDARALFNNAAQALNHGFFWVCMGPEPTAPSAVLNAAIVAAFGSPEALRDRFLAEGLGHFGSGWVWLTSVNGRLEVRTTHDGDTVARLPGHTPLLVCDLWEHAYYLDHKNDRGAYLAGWWERLVDWSFVSRQHRAAIGEGPAWTYPSAPGADAAASPPVAAPTSA